jgi:hemerythrin superfamily protein
MAEKGSQNRKNGQDAVSLLEEDHMEVRALFTKFQEYVGKSGDEKEKCIQDICVELTVHTVAEEDVFYPAIRRLVDGMDDLVEESLDEHAGVKDLIEEIQTMGMDDGLDERMADLADMVEDHVQKEEEEMFPKVRESGIDLFALGKQLAKRKADFMNGM